MRKFIEYIKLYYRAGNGLIGSARIAFKTWRKSK